MVCKKEDGSIQKWGRGDWMKHNVRWLEEFRRREKRPSQPHANTHTHISWRVPATPVLNITPKHAPVSPSAASPYPVCAAGLRAVPPPHFNSSSYLQWSPLTHLAMGLCCALPNDELCIRRCHFEKCNYHSDKADGPVLSGICCASIRSRSVAMGEKNK